MDTSAYLSKQGWLGAGHSLHPTGRGITKPLLVSQKANVLGIGKKMHDAHADQWWARAFDSSLRSLEVGMNEVTEDTGNVMAGGFGALDMVKASEAKWAGKDGLYAGFVKGATLGGTLTPEVARLEDGMKQEEKNDANKMDKAMANGSRTKKRRRKENVRDRISKEERRERKISKTKATAYRPTQAGDVITNNPDSPLTKEHRRQVRRERRVTREERRLTKLLMAQTAATVVERHRQVFQRALDQQDKKESPSFTERAYEAAKSGNGKSTNSRSGEKGLGRVGIV
ncbi:MAG: hypothetical protein Q9187_007661 [Circinaria calcarea]